MATSIQVPEKPVKFEYVFIPADTSYPIEAREFDQVELEDDLFIKMLKKYFALASPESGVDRAMLIKQMSEHAKRDITASMDSAALSDLLSMTSVDILTISLPMKDSGFQGVSLYCDDKGKSKKLQLNERAIGLGMSCGLVGQTFNGDVFFSRVFDDGENHWFRMNFGMADVSSSAEWVKRTAAQAANKLTSGPSSLSGLAEQFSMRTGSSPTVASEDTSAAPTSGETSVYKWYQTNEEIEVTILTGSDTKKSEIVVDIKPKSLKIRIADSVLVDAQLFDAVIVDESTWTFSQKDGLLQITLSKKSLNKMWTDLVY